MDYILLNNRTHFLLTYYFSLRDVIEHDEVTKHCNETYQTKSCYNVDDSILQAELS